MKVSIIPHTMILGKKKTPFHKEMRLGEPHYKKDDNFESRRIKKPISKDESRYRERHKVPNIKSLTKRSKKLKNVLLLLL